MLLFILLYKLNNCLNIIFVWSTLMNTFEFPLTVEFFFVHCNANLRSFRLNFLISRVKKSRRTKVYNLPNLILRKSSNKSKNLWINIKGIIRSSFCCFRRFISFFYFYTFRKNVYTTVFNLMIPFIYNPPTD